VDQDTKEDCFDTAECRSCHRRREYRTSRPRHGDFR
jgi:hypothetical protein